MESLKNLKFHLARLFTLVLLVLFISAGKLSAIENKPITGVWQPLPLESTFGIMGKRFDLYRNIKVPDLLKSGYLIGGFENRPGVHPWQGEHIGKFIHTVVLDYLITKDPKTKKELDNLVKRLLATQMENGYMGTYHPDVTFMRRPENGTINDDVADDLEYEVIEEEKPKGGWDVWTFRYNLHGLLFYENYFPNEDVVTACRKMGELLISIYGPGKYNLTKYGSRKGISAAVLLESIVMLYERTGEKNQYPEVVQRMEQEMRKELAKKNSLFSVSNGQIIQVESYNQ
jgi:DUF1680 family protein